MGERNVGMKRKALSRGPNLLDWKLLYIASHPNKTLAELVVIWKGAEGSKRAITFRYILYINVEYNETDLC